jgi:hypothetical protein
MPVTATEAPSTAIRRAVAAPIPDPAPVISATLPASFWLGMGVLRVRSCYDLFGEHRHYRVMQGSVEFYTVLNRLPGVANLT